MKISQLRYGWRVAVVLGSAILLSALVTTVFWFQDLRYSLPTPVPPHYAPPSLGAIIPLPEQLAGGARDARPVLLHFFNRDCPCSRFNLDQARALAQEFRGQVRFILVLQLQEEDPAARERELASLEQKFGGVEGIVDGDGQLAARYGVISTPQAVILNARGEIAYRGNYNVSRFCTDPATEFARQALVSVLAGVPIPPLPPLAYQAYGCELPTAHLP